MIRGHLACKYRIAQTTKQIKPGFHLNGQRGSIFRAGAKLMESVCLLRLFLGAGLGRNPIEM